MTCKDCLCSDVCIETRDQIQMLAYQSRNDVEKVCSNFKDKNRFVELPCENWLEITFGDEDVFYGIEEETISEINVYNEERISWYDGWRTVVIKGFDENGNYLEFSPEDIGKTVFLTREEAEEKLNEKS